MSKQYLLIGASAASFGAMHSIRRVDPHARITLISAESEWPYNKCFLADYLAGAISEQALSIYATPFDNVELILGQKVTAIDAQNKIVITDKGNSFAYDSLFLGMGSSPWIPSVPGVENPGVFTFHTHADAHGILAYIKSNNVRKIIVCGAGLSGLEAADALAKQGCSVTLIEKSNQVLPWMLLPQSADFLHTKIRECGVQLMLNASVGQISAQNGKVTGAIVNGKLYDADLVIIATGLRANTQLCPSVGIELDSHGVVVNEYLQTNLPDIYAGGDLIGVYDQLTGKPVRSCLWPDAMQQGMHAGMAMAGKPKSYAGISMITSTAFFGIKFAQAGIIDANAITKSTPEFYHTFALNDGQLKGFQVLGNEHNLGHLRRILLTGQIISIKDL